MNGFMERSTELLDKARKHKTDVETLKITKDKALKVAGEASIRAHVVERRARDAKEALKRSIEENSWQLGTQKALAMKVEELKTWSVKTGELEAKVTKAKTALKAIEGKIAKLQSELEV